MSLRYSYQPRNIHQHPLHAHPLQEPQEVEAEVEEAEVEEVEAEAEVEEAEAEVEEAEEEEAEVQTFPTSDSAETCLKYSWEKEKKQIASFPNSSAITWPTSESQSLTPGSEKLSSPAPTSKVPSSINGSTEQWTGSRDWIL